MYHADIGFVEVPKSVSIDLSTSRVRIASISECTPVQIHKLSIGMIDAFGSRVGISDPVDMTFYINKHWNSEGGDALFVMTDQESEEFLGCVAVDRKNFFPFIGNLYVSKDKRNRGLAARLMDYAERFICDGLKFDRARLWCDASLIDFYIKKGYIVEKDDDGTGVHVMVKSLNNTTTMNSYDADPIPYSFI